MQLKKNPVLKTVIHCMILIGVMIGFTIALIPMYTVFCKWTGLNGKVDLNLNTLAQNIPVNVDRWITVEFIVNPNQAMPWEFKPQHVFLKVHPGAVMSTGYFATNPTQKTIIAQAIPSISPFYAAKYFKKIECFCFSQQILGPGQSKNLPLRFYLDPNIPEKINRLTLAYTLFDMTEGPPAALCY